MFEPIYIPVPARRCERCGKRLAQLNREATCFACQRAEQEAIAARMFQPVTAKQALKGARRLDKGERRVGRRLTPEERQQILSACSRASMGEVAKQFGVSFPVVGKIVRMAPVRPDCPQGCGRTIHAGSCIGSPKSKRRAVTMRGKA